MTEHLDLLAKEIESRLSLTDDDIIVDIGSNDSTLLKSFKTGRKLGIDPTGTQFKSFYPDDIQLIPDYFSEKSFRRAFPQDQKAKIVTSISMFYDLPDPLAFARDIANILLKDGLWVTEQSYMPTMLEMNSFDTVCHEHLEYYTLKQLSYIAEHSGLKIVDVSLNSCNGGSFRITLAHKDSLFMENKDMIYILNEKEKQMQLNTLLPYSEFENRCKVERRRLIKFIDDQRRSGKTIGIYGASTKGNTLLQYYNITGDIIVGASERNPEKYGRRTPKTNIPIISENEMRSINPDYLIVLPWHFRKEFIERERAYLENGGQFIFPLPHVSIVSKNDKHILITGITGQSGSHLLEILQTKQPASIYGLVRNPIGCNKYNTVVHDFSKNNEEHLHDILHVINPDEIYHLAAETDATTAKDNLLPCFELNSLPIAHLCSFILNHKNTKLVVANSSEIYKGLGCVEIDHRNKHDVYPRNPYAIGKLSAYWICTYYREQFNLDIVNAFIFNCESRLRRDNYVAKKITNFVKSITLSNQTDILHLGNIDTYRPWMHAYDVANALYMIMNQEKDKQHDYFICSDKLISIREFIELTFKQVGINIKWHNNTAVDIDNGKEYVKYNDTFFMRTYEIKQEKIIGDNSDLKKLGWVQTYDISKLIQDLLA
jgi:GDP-mannose 4,6-dehydratase